MADNTCFPQLRYATLLPSGGKTLKTQLIDCYKQLKENSLVYDRNKEKIIKQTLFIKALNNNDFYDIKRIIADISVAELDCQVPTTVVAQAPENGALVALEMVILKEAEKHSVVHKSFSGSVYAIIRSPYSMMIISGGLSLDSDCSDILLQSRKSFEMMDGILQAEDFEFSDVIRQWNYI